MTKVKTFFCTVAVASAVVACGDNPLQVIEDVEFAASLGVDLSQMEMLNSGVYLQDLTVGAGDEVLADSVGFFTYAGYLTDGTLFGSGLFSFTVADTMGLGAIEGFDQGVVGMLEGGRRLLVIPPALAYGDVARSGIPAGSILVFDIMVDSVGASPPVQPN